MLEVYRLGLQEYMPVWKAMQCFSETRKNQAYPDQLWIVEHMPVYTLGLNGKKEHLLQATDIPLIPIDRGGQITYHGPGQIVFYPLLDFKNLQIKPFVYNLEQIVIEWLLEHHITAHRIDNAPGVYVNQAKIAAIGLRIKQGFSYHGLSINLDMDLSPFSFINPCGYRNLAVTQFKNLVNYSFDYQEEITKILTLFSQYIDKDIQYYDKEHWYQTAWSRQGFTHSS